MMIAWTSPAVAQPATMESIVWLSPRRA